MTTSREPSGETPRKLEVVEEAEVVPLWNGDPELLEYATERGLAPNDVQKQYDSIVSRKAAEEFYRLKNGRRRDLVGSITRRDALKNIPRVPQLIKGILPGESYSIIAGRDGTYKTFLAIEWGMHIATGKPWQGFPTEQRKVLYMSGEGSSSFHDRLAAWEEVNNNSVEVPGEMFQTMLGVPNLFTGVEFDEVLDFIEREKFGLVIGDTWSRMIAGANENSSDTAVAIDRINQITLTTKAAFLSVAHTGKSKVDLRGNSAVEDGADVIWYTDKSSDKSMSLKNHKQKDAEEAESMKFKPVAIGKSIVLERIASTGTAVFDEAYDNMIDYALKVSRGVEDVIARGDSTARATPYTREALREFAKPLKKEYGTIGIEHLVAVGNLRKKDHDRERSRLYSTGLYSDPRIVNVPEALSSGI